MPFMPRWSDEIFKHADTIICEGNHGKKILEKKGCPTEKVSVIKLGINTSAVSTIPKTKLPEELKLVQISTFTEKKGQIYSLLAFIESLKVCKNMHLTFVGGGSQEIKDEIQQMVTSKGLESQVTIKDFVPFKELDSFLKKFDVFIHPSCYSTQRDCEGGAPVVLLNAQFQGLPIISTFHCDIPDEVIDGETGFLANEKDVTQLSTFITRFYQMEKEEFEGMSKQAIEHVSLEYDSIKNAKALGILYRKLCSI